MLSTRVWQIARPTFAAFRLKPHLGSGRNEQTQKDRYDVNPLDSMGSLDTIATDYRKIPSGRLVVLGEPGSGKTILSMRLLLDFLNIRTKVEPVPVIFSIGPWNPAVSLRDYLTKCLTRDYPWLAVPAFNQSSLAGALIEKGTPSHIGRLR